RELASFAEALIDADAEVFGGRAEHAVAGAETLQPIAVCRDPARLRADPADDPAQRELVTTLQGRLRDARTRASLGEPTEGLAGVLAVVDEARDLDSTRTLVRALVLAAELEEKANHHDDALGHL